jgi:hypothetical protein
MMEFDLRTAEYPFYDRDYLHFCGVNLVPGMALKPVVRSWDGGNGLGFDNDVRLFSYLIQGNCQSNGRLKCAWRENQIGYEHKGKCHRPTQPEMVAGSGPGTGFCIAW